MEVSIESPIGSVRVSMSQDKENGSGTETKGSEEEIPEIRVKQDKILFLLIILMAACIGIICVVPFYAETWEDGSVFVFFRFWTLNMPSGSGSHTEPWFLEPIGIYGFATGMGMLALIGVSFIITLVHKINKNLYLENGAIVPFIIAGFSGFLWFAGTIFPPWLYYGGGYNPVAKVAVSDIAIGACGVVALVLSNVFRTGPWLRAPVSWKEAMQAKSMEAGIFPILLVLKKLQETKGSIDIMDLTRIYGRFKGTVKTKLDRARLTNLIKGQFQGPLNFFMETINLPFIIDDADVPPSIQASVNSMLARASANPTTSFPPATSRVSNIQPVTGSMTATAAVGSPVPAGGAVVCSGCGANVQGKDFCTNCGRKVPAATFAAGQPATVRGAVICSNCGTTVKGNFCSKCGTKIA